MPLVKVGSVGDMEENSVRSIEVEGEEIAIYFVCGRYYATAAICTHAYANLAEGWIDEDRCEIECPLHGSAFNLETGKPRTLPATQSVRTYSVALEGPDIFIDVSLTLTSTLQFMAGLWYNRPAITLLERIDHPPDVEEAAQQPEQRRTPADCPHAA